MSDQQAAVDVVRWIYELDWADVEAKRDKLRGVDVVVDPEFQSLLLDKPGAGTLHGLEGMVSFGEAIEQDFTELRYRPSLYEMAGKDRVVVSGQIEGRTRTSGHRLHGGFTHLWTLAGGRAQRVEAYPDRESALATLGPGA